MIAFDLDPGPAGHDRRVRRGRVPAARAPSTTSGWRRSPRRRAPRACRSTCRSTRPADATTRRKPFAQGDRPAARAPPPRARSSRRCARTCAAGKVFVDWSQNARHKTTVCVYSLRARERPTVSTPAHVGRGRGRAAQSRDPDDLAFTSDEVLARVAEHGDLFAPVLELRAGAPGGLDALADERAARRSAIAGGVDLRAACSSSSGVPESGISRTASLCTGGRSSASASASSTASPRPPSGQWSSTVTIAPHSRAAARTRLGVDRLDRVAVDHARRDAVAPPAPRRPRRPRRR